MGSADGQPVVEISVLELTFRVASTAMITVGGLPYDVGTTVVEVTVPLKEPLLTVPVRVV